MTKIIKIQSAEYLSDYKIEFVFSDRKKTVVDFKNFITKSKHPEIEKYANKSRFKKFTLLNGDIHWGDYDLIFPISDIYSGEIERKAS